MTLLSVLRNGDSRFLPLLLSKVHDVLPTLANPMLQTVPDTPATMSAEVDIFDGFGPMPGMGVPSNFSGLSNSSGSDFKMSNSVEFKVEHPLTYEKRIEVLNSPTHPESGENSPYLSPPIISSPMEFPEYASFPDLHGPNMRNTLPSNIGNFGEGVGGGGRQDFKREFEGGLGLLPSSGGVRRPPLRQGSGSSFGMQQIPRSVPEQQFHQLHRTNSHPEGGMGGGDLPFR